MLSFFPPPYPDELLYSVLARYHVRSGNTSPKMTLKDLYGLSTVSAVMDLPSYICDIIERLPLCIQRTADEIILKHTLFPYYAAFLTRDRASKLLENMIGRFAGNIHTSTGIMASGVQAPQYFKFCSDCIKEDIRNYGETYWHRLHQAPGVHICPTHKAILMDSQVKVHEFNKHEYIPANIDNCKPIDISIAYSKNDLQKLLITAEDIRWLLDHYYSDMTADEARTKYINLLAVKGFATVSGRVYQRELVESFKAYYGDNFLKLLHCEVNFDSQDNWLSSIVRKHRKAFHPLRHLLLQRFLGKAPDTFFRQRTPYQPFGTGPWPCLNAAADHYRKLYIRRVEISHSTDTKLPVGIFTCSCGFEYSRSGPDENGKEKYKIGRVKDFGSLWEDKLKYLVEEKKLGLRDIARRLNVDPATVKKYANKLHLCTSWQNRSNPEYQQVDEEVQKDEHNSELSKLMEQNQERWLALAKSNPELSKNELRKMDKALFIWLYRHNPKWLQRHSPSILKPKKNNVRVDWGVRDNEILQKVKGIVSELLSSTEKPEMITISRVGKIAGAVSLLEKHLDKLPRTKEFLTGRIESIEDFQIRRVQWAARQLDIQGEELKEWKVIRKAGLRTGFTDRVKMMISNEIQNYLKD